MGEYTTINPNSELKRREYDLYPTPEGLARAVIHQLSDAEPKYILDPGCGEGIWGKAAKEIWPNTHIQGVELRKEVEHADNSQYYDNIYLNEDYLHTNSLYPRDWQLQKYDLIMGNPPYYAAEDFIRTSFKYLEDGGSIVFLLRLAFLASRKRHDGLWKDYFPKNVLVLSRRPSFSGNKKTDGEEYAIFIWKKDWYYKYYFGSLLDWEY